MVAAFDELGLKPGDHLVTVLQNRWEAATLHWACQFAGIVITPVNWRAKADEIDYCLENAEAKAVVFEDVSAEAVAGIERRTRRASASRSDAAQARRDHVRRRCASACSRCRRRAPAPTPGR